MRPHKNLKLWKEAIILTGEIYKHCEKFPESEKFGLISQLKRCSISVPANIAEGAARNTKKEFINFLHISSGSLSELDTLLTVSESLGYTKPSESEELDKKINLTAALLNGLIRKLKTTT